MRESFSHFIRRHIGILAVISFMANVIMFSAIISSNGNIPSEQGQVKQNSFYYYSEQGITHRNRTRLVESFSINNSFKKHVNLSLEISKKRNRKINSNKKGEMDYVPSKPMIDEGDGDKRKNKEQLYQNSVEQTKVLPPNVRASKTRKRNALEQINSLANVNSGKVYHMYDNAPVVMVHNAHTVPAVKVKQKDKDNLKVPDTFNEEYIKYFWKHPELHEKGNNVEVIQGEAGTEQDFHDKTDKVKYINPLNRVKEDADYDGELQDKPGNMNVVKDNQFHNSNHKEDDLEESNKDKQEKKNISYMTMFPAKGQLGNQMFQLASLLGIADSGNFTPFLPLSVFDLNKVFKLPKGLHRKIDTATFQIFSENDYTQDSSIKYSQNLNIHKNWSLDGYFQSFKYFNHVPDKVRNYLKFHKHLLQAAVEFIKMTVPTGHITVAIHIRRGDFINSYEMKLGREAATPGYVQRAMKHFQSRYKNITFIVVSDDMKWCEEYIKGDNVVYSASHYNEKGVDLAIISECDHVIMSVGTFGWWGGWLSRGSVVYYNKFPRPGSELDKTFVPGNYYPSNWIALE